MRIEIDDEVFASPERSDAELLDLIHLGFLGRHELRLNPSWNGRNDRLQAVGWSKQWPRDVQAEVNLAFTRGLRSARAARHAQIEARGSSYWQGSPPRLTLRDGWELAHMPLSVLTEGARAEPWFLRRAWHSDPAWGRALRAAEAQGWLRFELGGGLDNMESQIEDAARDGRRAHRLWVLFDHDGDVADAPSEQSESLRMLCASGDIAHHQLERRDVESYIPDQALRQWPYLAIDRSNPEERSRKVEAFLAKPLPARHYLQAKKELQGRPAKVFERDEVGWEALWFRGSDTMPWPELATIFAGILERL